MFQKAVADFFLYSEVVKSMNIKSNFLLFLWRAFKYYVDTQVLDNNVALMISIFRRETTSTAYFVRLLFFILCLIPHRMMVYLLPI